MKPRRATWAGRRRPKSTDVRCCSLICEAPFQIAVALLAALTWQDMVTGQNVWLMAELDKLQEAPCKLEQSLSWVCWLRLGRRKFGRSGFQSTALVRVHAPACLPLSSCTTRVPFPDPCRRKATSGPAPKYFYLDTIFHFDTDSKLVLLRRLRSFGFCSKRAHGSVFQGGTDWPSPASQSHQSPSPSPIAQSPETGTGGGQGRAGAATGRFVHLCAPLCSLKEAPGVVPPHSVPTELSRNRAVPAQDLQAPPHSEGLGFRPAICRHAGVETRTSFISGLWTQLVSGGARIASRASISVSSPEVSLSSSVSFTMASPARQMLAEPNLLTQASEGLVAEGMGTNSRAGQKPSGPTWAQAGSLALQHV